jgi:glycosyltransferase involved in cell wall biosynthesis
MSSASKAVCPRICLVTPVYNSEKYLGDTIRSVVAQGYPNLDYFIVDGGSTDGTVDVIRAYEKVISGWISEPDRGMYNAINKGFARTTGEIMGWLNSGDMLHTGGLIGLAGIFRDLPEVHWVSGLPTCYSDEGTTTIFSGYRRWSRFRFLAGANRYIMQETTFWRRSLWENAGGYVDESGRCGVVSDFELWVRFFRHARLYPVHALIGGYRTHPNSMGTLRVEECHRIQQEIVDAELNRLEGARLFKFFCKLGKDMKKVRGLRYAWRLVERQLYTWPASDWPPMIFYDGQRWYLEKNAPRKMIL